ncbi:hypothetical protein [Christiangramia sediminis]|uniref:Lipocalin-like domain-containing protein n=1 Tax=Christiangramia sediminis TaxID=2881336 RepID=A0A9X1LH97_9FLAO|nr:hypothetical protein [Christiangramia sediminis]MCB7480263.1 hypothetical protein [Christiangramia sediminis]
MKITNLKHVLLVLLMLSITTISCSSDDDNNPDQQNPQVISQIENNIRDGNWRITKFIDSNEDETNHFNGFNFTFGANGVLIAENENDSFEGTWSITDSDNSDDDDDSADDLDFNINFNLSNDFEDLNDDWDILTHSSNKIELIDVSGGNGGSDYLTFEKN